MTTIDEMPGSPATGRALSAPPSACAQTVVVDSATSASSNASPTRHAFTIVVSLNAAAAALARRLAEAAHDADHFRKADGLVERRRRLELAHAIGLDAGEDDDRNAGEHGIGALFAAKGPAVHDRHAQVQQDGARAAAAAQIRERFLSVGGRNRRESFELQKLDHQAD